MGASPGGTADKLGGMTESVGPKLLPPLSLDAMGIFERADRAWVEGLIVSHPMKCLEDVVHLEHGDPKVPRSYVYCSARESMIAFFGGIDPLATFVERAREEDFRFYEIASGHHPMITHAKELAEVLGQVASR